MREHEPLVSVVIPVWNTENTVKKLIERLLEQTYKNLEIIAVDDGSTDNSLAMLQELAQKNAQVKVIHQKNAGASVARNAGIRVANGKYVVFVDSDDDVAEDFIEKLVRKTESGAEVALVVVGMRMNKLQSDDVVNVHVEPRRKRRESERKADYLLELLLRDGRMHSSVNKIFRLDVIQEFGLKFEEGRDFAEDTKFVLDYLEHAPGEIEFVLEPLYIYNFGTETSTVKLSSTIWKNWAKSYTDLKKWAMSVSGGKLYWKTRMLLGLVLLRWRISHRRAKKRALRARITS